MPVLREKRMDDYISIHLKEKDGFTEAEENMKDYKLIERIHSTIKKQNQEDKKDIDRLTTTLVIYI